MRGGAIQFIREVGEVIIELNSRMPIFFVLIEKAVPQDARHKSIIQVSHVNKIIITDLGLETYERETRTMRTTRTTRMNGFAIIFPIPT